MKNYFISPKAAFQLLLLTFFACVVVFGINSATVGRKDHTPEDSLRAHGLYCISPDKNLASVTEDFEYHYNIPMEYKEGLYLLIYDPYYFDFSTKSGNKTFSFHSLSSFHYFHMIPLFSDAYNAETDSYQFTVKYTGKNSHGIFLTNTLTAGLIQTICTNLRFIAVGFFVFAILALTVLYMGKTSESYLLYLITYLVIQFIYSLCLITPMRNHFFVAGLLYNSIIFFVVPMFIFKIYTLKKICGYEEALISLKEKHRFLVTLLNLPFQVIFFFAVLMVSFLLNSDIFSTFLAAIYLLLGLLELGLMLTHKTRDSLPLLIGFVTSLALFLLNIIYLFDWIYLSIPMALLIAAEYTELPFSVGCLIFVLRRYSYIFKSVDILVEQRTEELKNKEQEKHNLMLNVFHDLRTPIFIIQEYSKLIHGELLPEQQELKESIVEPMLLKIDFLKNITEDLFTVAKLENNSLLFVEDHVRALPLLKSISSGCQISCQSKGITYHSSIDADCMLWGDEARLTQAIENITSNAVHYTPEGGTVSMEASLRQDKLIIRVSDTGIGISEEDMKNIFKRYFRANKDHTNSSTGLGLCIAREIIVKHHGTIDVASKLGTGTTFTIELPYNTEHGSS